MPDDSKRYWLTPPDIYAALETEYGPFDFDPCPHPLPKGGNGLVIPWGRMNYVNPPFRPADVENTGIKRPGPTAFAHKAIAEHRKGRGSVLVLPVQSYVMHLAAAGAEIRSMGRVRWLDTETGEPCKSPSPICAFILKPELPNA